MNIITDEGVIKKLEEFGFGSWIEDGSVFGLNDYELSYCLERNYIDEGDIQNLETNLKANSNNKINSKIYKIFSELRRHGIIIRFTNEEGLVRVYQKGFRPGEDRTKYLMKIVVGSFPKKDEIDRLIKISKNMRKELLFAIVDEKITYLKIGTTTLF